MRRRKWTLTVPKCFQCKWQRICEETETERRSEACLWFHYSYNTVAQYDDQWLDWDDPTTVGFARCSDCGTQMTLSQYDAGPYLCALCGKEMTVDTKEKALAIPTDDMGRPTFRAFTYEDDVQGNAIICGKCGKRHDIELECEPSQIIGTGYLENHTALCEKCGVVHAPDYKCEKADKDDTKEEATEDH